MADLPRRGTKQVSSLKSKGTFEVDEKNLLQRRQVHGSVPYQLESGSMWEVLALWIREDGAVKDRHHSLRAFR
jgi:hypothetical protein